MKKKTRGTGFVACALVAVLGASTITCSDSTKLPEGYLSQKESDKVLAKTLTIRLDPDLSQLSEAEFETTRLMVEAGKILHNLYEVSRHPQSLTAQDRLKSLHEELGQPQATQNLLDIYRFAKGPIMRNLDGKLEAFVPVEERHPGRNVYPWGIEKSELASFLEAHPDDAKTILAVRSVVRRSTQENLDRDLRILEEFNVLSVLHPGLEADLEALAENPAAKAFYAVPYSVEYAEDLFRVRDLILKAASLMEDVDADYARYLKNRARDLLTDDYEAGDASWVTGRFDKLNAQIGAYENYDDQLYGVKAFFSLSVLVKDPAMSNTITTITQWMQEMEDLLPYEHHKKVRTDIPIGAYNVVADFGQARGTNTASILPNESYITRKYGRTILLRYNIMTNPELFAGRMRTFAAAVDEEFVDTYTAKGDFFRTLWHEIGHYLGPDLTHDGATLDEALEEDSSILEELKADLVSLFLAKRLRKKGYYTEERLRSVQASGIRRLLRRNQPTKAQAYATMQNMQLNYYLEKKLLTFDPAKNRLRIDYSQYHQAVESMLREVMGLQYNGDKAAADAFIDKYSTWDPEIQGKLAKSMKQSEKYRYAIVRYAALGE